MFKFKVVLRILPQMSYIFKFENLIELKLMLPKAVGEKFKLCEKSDIELITEISFTKM